MCESSIFQNIECIFLIVNSQYYIKRVLSIVLTLGFLYFILKIDRNFPGFIYSRENSEKLDFFGLIFDVSL